MNRIADARLHPLAFKAALLPILVGLWLATGIQRAVGAYMGYGRNLVGKGGGYSFLSPVPGAADASWRGIAQ